jgi:hypothetical protein
MKTCGEAHNLSILAVEAVVRKCLTRITFTLAAAYPGYPGAASRPLDEGFDPRRQCRSAAIRAVMNDKRTRQRRRRPLPTPD